MEKTMTTTFKRLEGKVAIVTGASKGIGAEIAKRLALEGASVAVNYASSKDAADAVVAEIVDRGGKAVAIKANMTNKKEIESLVEQTVKTYGRLDVLVNNAGIYEFAALEEVTDELYRRQFDTNVLGLLNASQAALKHFGNAGGSIINISSLVSTLAVPMSSVYSGTKGAVDAITRSLASELGARQIRVNSINPGMVQTEGVKAAGFDSGDFRAKLEADTPLGRIGLPQDIAPLAAFLASSESSWITGESFRIAGGLR